MKSGGHPKGREAKESGKGEGFFMNLLNWGCLIAVSAVLFLLIMLILSSGK